MVAEQSRYKVCPNIITGSLLPCSQCSFCKHRSLYPKVQTTWAERTDNLAHLAASVAAVPEELKGKEIGKSEFNNTQNSQEQHGEFKFTELLPEFFFPEALFKVGVSSHY